MTDAGIESVAYRGGMLEAGDGPDTLPVRNWSGPELPEEVRAAIGRERILELGGTYGDETAGDPLQYEHLRIVTASGTVEITFFNRGIALLMTDDERLRRLHRVLWRFRELR